MVSEDVPQPHLGGLGKHALALAHELARLGHSVDVLGNGDNPIAAHPEQTGPGRFFGEIVGHQRGWKQSRIGAFHPLTHRLNARNLASAMLEHAGGYDVVHYHGHLPWVAAKLPRSIPFIQTRHDQGGDCMLKTRFLPTAQPCQAVDPEACASCATRHPNALQTRLSAAAVRQMRQDTALAFDQRPVIFVSRFLQQGFARVSGRPVQGTVIHNGIDVNAVRRALASKLPCEVAPDRVELFSAGAVTAYKGFGALLAVLTTLGLPAAFRLTIAGDGPELASLKSRYSSRQIRFLDWCDYESGLAHAAQADAVIVPSLCEESCSSTTLEALALGRVVYALHRGGTPELAAYAGVDGARLKLFPTMMDLAAALVQHQGGAQDPLTSLAQFHGGMAEMAQAVLAHYAASLGVH